MFVCTGESSGEEGVISIKNEYKLNSKLTSSVWSMDGYD